MGEPRITVRIEFKGSSKLGPMQIEILLHITQDLPLEEKYQGTAGNRDRHDDAGNCHCENAQPDGVRFHGCELSMM